MGSHLLKGEVLRVINSKNDWFYEMRPQIITVFGIIGVLNISGSNTNLGFKLISQISGIVLLVIAYKIRSWRREYRRTHLTF